jgi:putative spermidine/putrescine transport system ATP-binding protein
MYSGRIEQMGTPTEMYSRPATPFVAEFIGTMNRLEATVVDPVAGGIEHGGVTLHVDAARGRERGERVLVLVRPESLELTAATNGDAPAENTLTGEVLTQTFLGPVTRLKVVSASADLIADLPTARAEALPVGSRVSARVPEDGARLLTLVEDLPVVSAEPDLDGQ